MCYGVLYAVIDRRPNSQLVRRRSAPLLAATAVIASLACGDPLGAKANLATQTDTLVAFSLSGTPISFPSAWNTVFRTVVRVDVTHNYDVAFDIDTAGNVKLIPVKLMGGVTTITRRVGLQKATVPFEQLTRAPGSGYEYDSVLVVKPNQAVAVELTSPDQCSFFLSSLLYSKMVVDSVDAATRQIYFRTTHDPNCGYRSFQPGVPKN